MSVKVFFEVLLGIVSNNLGPLLKEELGSCTWLSLCKDKAIYTSLNY